MNIWKKPWFIPIVLTIIIVVAGQLYTSGKLTKAEVLPEQEIRSQLAMIYDGEVKDLILDGSIYKANVTRAGMEYAVEVDASTSKVLSLIQTKDNAKANGEVTDVPDPNKARETSKPADNSPKTVLISDKKAEEIALAQLPAGTIGEVDDVDFVNSAEGGYYLVQLDIDTTDDMDEVTYQIHAISGKVLTVTWDD